MESIDKPVDSPSQEPIQREIEDTADGPERSLMRREVGRSVQDAVASLSSEYREVVALYYVDGADVAQISQILKCPEGTVKSRLARARGELKRKLAHLVE